MTDSAWIGSTLISTRPRVMGALMRYFRDLDLAEEAFQTGCLRALQVWPRQGPPRDPSAWLIRVGRNAGIDDARRRRRAGSVPLDDCSSDLEDVEALMAERLDASHYRDDILRLLFVCAHPDLPPTQQIALALRVVSGMSVSQIASAFLVNERAMQQRITRAKAAVAASGIPFDSPSLSERTARLRVVSAIIYLMFNEGYSSGSPADAATPLCAEAIRLSRILLDVFPSEPEIMGLLALMLLHQSRSRARFDAEGGIVLMDQQDRSRWDGVLIAEGLALIDKAVRHRTPGPYQIQAALAAVHIRAVNPHETDWVQIERLYGALERLQPSPVIALNRAVAVAEISGPQAALDLLEPLADRLAGYFNYFGVKGGLLLKLGRVEEARVAFNQAIGLSRTAAQAVHIRARLDSLSRL